MEEIGKNEPNIFSHSLNPQQKLTVHTLKDHDFFLNYSDTGAGKTKAAISSSYYLGAKHVLIFCPNNVKGTWKKQIEEANFTKSENIAIDEIFAVYNNEDYLFEIFNYDKFNQDNRASVRIKNILKSKRYDLIVFDEIHRLKNNSSITYKNVAKLVWSLKNANPNIKFLGATATPITTSNSDLRSIFELLSGKKADDLTVGNEANRLINANKVLETCGFGYFPERQMEVRFNGIPETTLFKDMTGKQLMNTPLANIDGSSIEKDCLMAGGNVSKLEEIHLLTKFNAYKHLVRKGTVIYTEYTYGDKILMALKDMVEDTLHLSACIYSGEFKETEDGKDAIEEFVSGAKDVLIGTKSMCEGVDGIQKVSNRLILHTIPSVWSVMHQLIGRFARQGSNYTDEGVDVFVPMVIFNLKDGRTTSFDKRRWMVAMRRRNTDNIVKGGCIEEITVLEKKQMIDEVINKLKDNYELTEIGRENVNFDIEVDEQAEWERRESIISDFNRRGKTTNTKRFHDELINDPEKWHEYHKARRESMKNWNEIPYEYIATKIKNKNRMVADFGCGDNKLRTLIPDNKVYSFDHIAADSSVIACDMTHTPLDDQSVDIAVFSLSLWGTNYADYFKEAYRVLNYDGLMYIAEPTKAYDEGKREELKKLIVSNGFSIVGDVESRGKFFYLTAVKL